MTNRIPYQSTSNFKLKLLSFILPVFVYFLVFSSVALAGESTGETLYKQLSSIASSGNNNLIEQLNTDPREFDWTGARTLEFNGHLRFLSSVKEGNIDQTRLYFIRSAEGEIFILSIPDKEDPDYQNLEELIESKLIFSIKVLELTRFSN